MTTAAGIRHIEIPCQLRCRDLETVIASIIDLHIGCRGHMAVNTLAAGLPAFVAEMAQRVID